MNRNHSKSAFSGALAALALVSLAAPALAGEGSTSGSIQVGAIYFVESDPENAAKFFEYRDVPEGLVIDELNFEWNANDTIFAGGMFVELEALDVTQGDQQDWLTFGSRGKWKGELGYYENPRLWGDNSRQLYSHDGHGTFTLEDSLQTAMQNAPNAADTTPADGVWDAGTKGAILRDATAQHAEDVEIGWQRKTGEANFEFTPTNNWRFGFDSSRETRRGTRLTPLYTPMAEVGTPVDYTTDFLTPFLEFKTEHFVVGAKYTWSKFEADDKIVTWDNVAQLLDGPLSSNGRSAPTGRGRMVTGSDNEMEQWEIYAAGNLPGHTRITAAASGETTTQNDIFVDQTVNSVLQPKLEAAPYLAYHLPERFDGEYENTMYDLRIDSRPLSWFRVKAWWHEYEQDNQSEMYEVPTMNNDGSIPADPTNPGTSIPPANAGSLRANLPFSYEKTNYGLLLGFDPADWANVQLSWENEDIDRHYAAIHGMSEDTWKLTADFDVTDKFTIRTTGKWQDRNVDGHGYHVHYFEESYPNGESVVFPVNEGTRKFMWTDRERDSYALMAEFTPTEKIAIYAQYDYSHSNYSDPNTGLGIGKSYEEERLFPDGVTRAVDIMLAGREEDTIEDWTLGLSITPNKDWDIGLFYTWETSSYDMASRYRNVTNFWASGAPATGAVSMGWDYPEDDWFTQVDDDMQTYGVDWKGSWAEGKWSMFGSATWTHAEGDIHNDFAAGQGTIPAGIGNRAAPQVIGASGDSTLVDFPQLDNDYLIAKLGFERNISNGWDLGMELWYEEWTYDDWQNDYKDAYIGNPTQDPADSTWVLLGTDFEDYDVFIVEVYGRYKF